MLNDAERDCLRSFLHAPHPYQNAQKLYAYVESRITQARADERKEYAKICDVTGPDDTTSENCAERIRARKDAL